MNVDFNTDKGESKSKGKIHLTALIEVTVSNFTYHFSHSPLATWYICYIVQLVSVFLRRRSFSAALKAKCALLPSLPHRKWSCNCTTPPSEDQRCHNCLTQNLGCKEDVEEVWNPVVALSLLLLLLYEDMHCHDAVRLFWTAFIFFSCKLQV